MLNSITTNVTHTRKVFNQYLDVFYKQFHNNKIQETIKQSKDQTRLTVGLILVGFG